MAKIYDVDYDYDCIRHELGHCLGLRHAQGLEAGNKIVGIEDHDAEHHEYGDVFDVMGEGDKEEHFNIAYKSYFNWFDDQEIKHVVSNGTYRLYTHDQAKRSGEIVGLTLTSGNGRYTYWIEFRTQGASSPGINSKKGVQVHLTGYMDNSPGKDWYRSDYAETISYLLDMTPNSRENDTWHANDFKDAELLVGKTFQEPDGAFTITPVAVSSNVGDEMAWIDVKITLKNSGPIVVPQDAGARDSSTRDTPSDTGTRDAAARDSRDSAGGAGDSAGVSDAGAAGRGGTADASGGSSGEKPAAADAGTAARDGAAGTGPASAGRAGCSCRAPGGDAGGTSHGLAIALFALALVSRSLRRRR